MKIHVGNLVLVCAYGDSPTWVEVVGIGLDTVICSNGLGEEFEVPMKDVMDVSVDDSVLKLSFEDC